VLHYPKFRFEPTLLARILEEELLPWVHKVEEPWGRLKHPPADRHDEPFLRTALGAQAEVLVSGDPHLTLLDGKYPFPILSPALFLSRHFKEGH
jgi:predicted nucleic acid-binding protein